MTADELADAVSAYLNLARGSRLTAGTWAFRTTEVCNTLFIFNRSNAMPRVGLETTRRDVAFRER